MVLGGPGGPGGITNRRGMKKYPGGLIFVILGWNYEGFMPIFWFILDHSDMQILRVLSIFHKIGIWAHNTPPKVVPGGCGLQS